MPITINCPGCRNKLNAPDSAAGKRVKCPKCQKVLTLPAPADDFEVVEDDFEVVEDEDLPPMKKSKPALKDEVESVRAKQKRRDLRDDEEDEQEERPLKKSKKKTAAKSKLPMLIGGAIAAILVLGGGGYLLFGGNSGKDKSQKDGWVQFQSPDSVFKGSFPATPTKVTKRSQLGFGGEDFELTMKQFDVAHAMGYQQVISEMWNSKDNTRQYLVTVMALPQPHANGKNFEDMLYSKHCDIFKKHGSLLGEQTMSVGGHNPRVFRGKYNNGKSFMSVSIISGKTMVELSFLDDQDISFDDEKIKRFCSEFKIL